ncbi:uncharacterized protein LOC134184537 isoform X2 [Corticium candelabrum]|uniref:uncharacterized protein LOC134184537 isoform X2 n=1 Tax=Corticium candelabrum TaxID=121492 RepID=UPI002E320520|nr:uncharacterized protein LOC134184537 isoform X2 [Corticium candelabrum]
MEAILRLTANAANTVEALQTNLHEMLSSERYVGKVWRRLEPTVLEQSRRLVSYVRTLLQALDKTVEHERDLLEIQGQKLFDLTREVLSVVKQITEGLENSPNSIRRVASSWKQQTALLHDLFMDSEGGKKSEPSDAVNARQEEVASITDEIRSSGNTTLSDESSVSERVNGHVAAENGETKRSLDGSGLQRKATIAEKALFINCDTLCMSCASRIDSEEHVVVQTRVYHRRCYSCCECGRMLERYHKVYTHGDKPCCPRCIYPVFDSPWSPHSTLTHQVNTDETADDKRQSCVSVTASVAAALAHSEEDSPKLPHRLKSFSRDLKLSFSSMQRIIRDKKKGPSSCYSSSVRERTVARSISPPVASSIDWENPTSPPPCRMTSRVSLVRARALKKALSEEKIARRASESSITITEDFNDGEPRFESLSSLEYILNNWIGLDYVSCILYWWYFVFWLDVEQFKHFDGNQDDLALYAQHIISKYIVDEADLAVYLPARLRQQVLAGLDNPSHNMFTKAQSYTFAVIERDMLDDFLKSEHGLQYLKALVDQDNERKMLQRQNLERLKKVQIEAKITSFDKRRDDSKYYVYEVNVTIGHYSLVVYRRYSDFFQLSQTLRSEFPQLSFPPLPKKILFGRSQVQSVAAKRMGELNTYLQKLLSMGSEVTNSSSLLMFFRQTEVDAEDEAFNRKLSVKGAGRHRITWNNFT